MATITLPVVSQHGSTDEVFEIDKLSFARSITRQGMGARKGWRRHLSQLRFPVIESDEVRAWNAHRALYRTDWHDKELHGIRAEYRFHLLDDLEDALQGDPWAMIDGPTLKPGDPADTVPAHGWANEQTAPGADD